MDQPLWRFCGNWDEIGQHCSLKLTWIHIITYNFSFISDYCYLSFQFLMFSTLHHITYMRLFMIHRIQLFILPSTLQFIRREDFFCTNMKTTTYRLKEEAKQSEIPAHIYFKKCYHYRIFHCVVLLL